MHTDMTKIAETATNVYRGEIGKAQCSRCGHIRMRHSERRQFFSGKTPGVLLPGYPMTLTSCNSLGGFMDP